MHVEALTLSICGGIQPGKLAPYVQGAIDGGDGADGLLQRIQLLVWPDSLGGLVRPNRYPDIEAKNRAIAAYAWLDELDPSDIGAESTQGDIPFLRFAPDAQRLMGQWRDKLEARLRSNELEATPAFEAHLSKYRSHMPSLALLFHLVALAFGGVPGGVTFGATKLAAVWCEYLEQHANKVYAAELYPGIQAAHLLAMEIQTKAIPDLSRERHLPASLDRINHTSSSFKRRRHPCGCWMGTD